ncbi:MAG: MCP four helix bundle domain-containing protein [Proteobacteria bacterium]|nr:MCP four helix bundle domain-containing protein [Pseudomonadota bacterium]MBU1610942.1 MCP four helix bundle domain-containing protein [Pseudomonadota bacterium]
MTLWKNLGVGLKILSGYGVLMLLLLGVGAVGFFAASEIQLTVEDLFEVKLPSVDNLIEADRDLQQLLVAERSMIFANVSSDVFKGLVEDYEANLAQVVERTGIFFSLMHDEETLALKEKFESAMADWQAVSRRIVNGRLEDTRAGRSLALDLTLGEANDKFEAMRDVLDVLTGKMLTEAEQAQERSTAEYASMRMQLLGFVLVSVILTGLLAFFISRGITGPVGAAVRLAEAIQVGDLSSRLKLERKDEMGRLSAALDAMSDVLEDRVQLAEAIAQGNLAQDVVLASEKDALGKALQGMVANMNEALGLVKDAADQIAAGAAQVSEASQSLSQGSTEQAASIEEINSSMTEIGSQTRTNAESASEANQKMEQAVGVVGRGKQAGQDMALSMQEISDASQQVAKIIKVIDEIAFQTNLLALNAAVEAARAGSHGKGFAVVAEEVRNLAGRSAKAAQETTGLIESAVSKVAAGMGLAERLDSSFEEIVGSSSAVAEIVAEIAKSSNEQALGVAQVNTGMNQVDQVTQQNTANAEETASAATVLSDQATQLQETLTRFKLSDAGTTVTVQSVPRQALPERSNLPEDEWEDADQGDDNDENDFKEY